LILLVGAALAAPGSPPVVVRVDDFALSNGGYTSAGLTGQWEWGVPTTGPGGAATLWGTNLGGDYLNDTVDTLTSPPLDLTGVSEPVLVLHHWFDIASPDAGWVEIDGGAGFARVAPVLGYPDPAGFTGSSGGYVDHVFDLAPFGTSPRVQLVLSADDSVAADGWYAASIALLDGDASPPAITVVVGPPDTQDLVGPYPVTVSILEEGTLSAADLHFEVEESETVVPLTPTGGTEWTGEIPAMVPGTDVQWWITACDGTWETRAPATDAFAFRVYLAAPSGLALDGERAIGQSVPLVWDPPDSPEIPLSYELWRDGLPLFEVPGAHVEAPVELPVHTFAVRASYAAGWGDLSTPLEVAAEVPTLTLVEPASAWPGDRVRVRIEGHGLYLVRGTGDFGFGPGTTVSNVAIDSADAADVVVEIAAGAAEGPRAVSVGSGWGRFRFPAAFEVENIATAPAILDVAPASLAQAGAAIVAVTASVPFAGPIAVEGDRDLVVTRPPEVDGASATFGIAVSGDARVGAHTLVLDDGQRLWTVPFEVVERVIIPPHRGCAHTPPVGLPLAGLALVLLRRRRATR
jgi:MYXO-CTERM domain-containing protein